MPGRTAVFCIALTLAGAGSVRAQDFVAAITQELRDQGFDNISVRRTLLGRSQIVATSTVGQREIIVNPNTGEILRDIWDPADGVPGPRLLNREPAKAGKSGRDSGGSGSGDDGDDGDGGDGHGGDGDGGDGHGDGGDGGGGGSGGEGGGGDGGGHGGEGEGSDGD